MSNNNHNVSYYKSLVETISANVNNDRLSDAEFREFIRNSVPKFKKVENVNEDIHDDQLSLRN